MSGTRLKCETPANSRQIASLSLALAVMGCVFTLATSAAADVLTLKDGRTLEGKVIAEKTDAKAAVAKDAAADADNITLQTRYGTVSFARAEVVSIEYSETFEERVDRVLARLDETGANDEERVSTFVELAGQAGERGWSSMQRDLLMSVLALAPGHVPAREALGYQLIDGKWMTEDEVKVAQGLVKFKGKWVHPDEVRAAEAATYWNSLQSTVNKLVKKMGSKVSSRREQAYDDIVKLRDQIPGIVEGADRVRDYYDRYYRALAARGEVVAEIRATNAALQRPIETFQTSLATGSVFSVATQVQIQIPELSVTGVRTTVAIPASEDDDDE